MNMFSNITYEFLSIESVYMLNDHEFIAKNGSCGINLTFTELYLEIFRLAYMKRISVYFKTEYERGSVYRKCVF